MIVNHSGIDMKYILTPGQMRQCDESAINHYGIHGAVLMENAARSAAIYIRNIIGTQIKYRILILCGSGNNGGDGFALARHLFEDYNVTVAWIGSREKMSHETEVNFTALQKIGVELFHLDSDNDISGFDFGHDCIIDSMIGVGGSENLRGLVVPILKRANSSDAFRVAIDSPTGLNTATGAASSGCFVADLTITMFAVKTGMLIRDGIEVCGEILTADLGAPEFIVQSHSKIRAIEKVDIRKMIPLRRRISSKFDYGRVLVIAGSDSMPGAAALAANAAINSGAGLVYLATTNPHPSLKPEIIPFAMKKTADGTLAVGNYEALAGLIDKCDVIAIGPGIGENKETIGLMGKIIGKAGKDKLVIIDADGLKAIDIKKKYSNNVIITPHIGEFAALINEPRDRIADDAHGFANAWANKLGCTILLKHVPTIITNGSESYWNTNGNPGMATAGSGDVLTGIIAALLPVAANPLEAAALAAFIHASAGDEYCSAYSQETLTAGKMIDYIKEVM